MPELADEYQMNLTQDPVKLHNNCKVVVKTKYTKHWTLIPQFKKVQIYKIVIENWTMKVHIHKFVIQNWIMIILNQWQSSSPEAN